MLVPVAKLNLRDSLASYEIPPFEPGAPWHNYWAWDHTSFAPGSEPLLVLDMYEHAYHLDYGAAAARYIDAFMQDVDWEEVARRLVHATSARQGEHETREATWNPG